MQRTNWVYIATNEAGKPLYHGSTWDPATRWDEHLRGTDSSTVRRYGLTKIVWFKAFSNKETALEVEHRLKRKSRARKLPMIEAFNPDWRDMSADWLREAAREMDV
ncbi:MAG: GIY-YIG nuclease family protein [Pseudomonadota bacterium]